jgi:hypothetical protein
LKFIERAAKMGFDKETISKERAEDEAACEIDVSAPKAEFVEKWQTIAFTAYNRQLVTAMYI